MTSSERLQASYGPRHLAIGRVVRLISEVRLAVLVLAAVSASAGGSLSIGGALVVVVAVPFSLVPARSWEKRGELFSRSGILLSCDLVMTVLTVVVVGGDLMTVYAAATVALLGVLAGTRLALVMALPIALLLLGKVTDGGVDSWMVLVTGAIGVLAMAWAGNALGEALRAQDAAARELLAARSANAAAGERIRIARDLHDTVAGDLAGARLLSRALAGAVAQDPASERTLQLARSLVETCATAHTHIREALGELRQAERGPTAELVEVCDDWSARTGVEVRTRIAADVEQVCPTLMRDVRLILTELLENVRKHAAACSVTVEVTLADGDLLLVVEDDGLGMDLSSPAADGHYGLRGIDERVTERHGRAERSPSADGGLRTEIALPIERSRTAVEAS